MDGKETNIQPHPISVLLVSESLKMHSLKSCEECPYQTFSYQLGKRTATPMAHIDPVFNIRFWTIWG